MKLDFAIAMIMVAAVVILQPVGAKLSSDGAAQSVLDPLAIQQENRRSAKQKQPKHDKNSRHKQISERTQVSKKYRRAQLADVFDGWDPGSLNNYQKSSPQRKKPSRTKISANSGQKAPASSRNDSYKRTAAATTDKKNIFESSADAAGKMITAPARGLRALFKSKQGE